MQWNNASDDWHTTKSEVDLRVGGKFLSTMAARDGSASFDFWGIYSEIVENRLVANTMGDGRKMRVEFSSDGTTSEVVESFEVESEYSVVLQRAGWLAILDNFRKYVESR